MKKTVIKILVYMAVCIFLPFFITVIMGGLNGVKTGRKNANAVLSSKTDTEINYIVGTAAEFYKAEDGTEIVRALVVMARTNMEYMKLNGAETISAGPAPNISEATYEAIIQAIKDTDGIVMKKEGQVFLAECYQDMHTVTKSQDELVSLLKKQYSCEFTGSFIDDFQIIERNQDGSIKEVMAGSIVMSGDDFAKAVGLSSTAFTVSQKDESITFTMNDNDNIMSVSKARTMAQDGKSYSEILMEFYKNIEFVTVK